MSAVAIVAALAIVVVSVMLRAARASEHDCSVADALAVLERPGRQRSPEAMGLDAAGIGDQAERELLEGSRLTPRYLRAYLSRILG